MLEFVAGILGFVFRNEVLNLSNREYQDRWNNSVQRYRVPTDSDYDSTINNAVDFLQRTVCLLYAALIYMYMYLIA